MKLIKVSLMFVIIIILYSCSNNESITNPNISNNSDTNSLKKEVPQSLFKSGLFGDSLQPTSIKEYYKFFW